MESDIRIITQIHKISEDLTSTWYITDEIKILPKLIKKDEDVLYFTSGRIEELKADSAIVVLTSKRILFYDAPITATREQSIPLKDITNIYCSSDSVNTQIIIEYNNVTQKITKVIKEEGDNLCRLAENRINRSQQISKSGKTNKSDFVLIDNCFIRKTTIIEIEQVDEMSIKVTTSKIINGENKQFLMSFNSKIKLNNFLMDIGV